MSTATSQAPSTPIPSRHHRQADIEPDKAWKDNLYKTIEETLQSMVDDAKTALDERLAAAATEEARGLAEEEYHKAMNTIRNLAKESFQAQLNRERQERMWAVKHVKKAEQEEILTRSKKTSLGTTSTNSTTNYTSAANFSTSVPAQLPTSSSFPPRNGPTTIPAAPPRVNDEHSDGNSPRGPDIRNFDPPRPEPRRPQPDPSPPKRRSASTEVHSTTIFPSSMTKSPIPPPSPFSPGAPLRPQDPSPTLGIAPINVVARDLPPELAARRDQYSSLSRRGSNAASQAREGYPRPPIPSFSSPKIEKQPQPPPPLPDDHVPTDPEDESPPPSTSRYNPRRTSGSQDRGSDAGPSRSVERTVAYSPSDRIPARSPSNPQMWKASVSPEEETVPPRTGSGLARRGSTTSIRSTGSGNIRPNIAEAIPEHEHESSERTKESEPPRKRDSHQSRPSDQPIFGPPTRPDSWSEPMLIYEEPTSSNSPPKPSSTSRPQDVMGPPPVPPTRPPSTRKPSYQTDDRDLYQSQRLRNQTSFDDRPFPSPYTPAPPASRPSPRPGADFYEYPRPRDYYPPYSAPLTPDSPYTGEQRSNTWRRATQPESPPTRRSTENNWSAMTREPSYGSKYPRAEDDSPLAYDDHRYHSFEYPSVKYDKYDSHQSSAIPIRQRNPSYNDDINGNGWKTSSAAAWGEPVTRPRTSRPREFDDYPTSRGYDTYDRDREYRSRDDLWGRDERDYDRDDHRATYDRGYHGSRYSSEMVHSNSRDSYGPGPRSSPSSYRNEQYRFGGREYRPSFDDEEDDDYLDNPYSREYPDSSRYSRDYHRVRRSNFEREAATARTELFKDIRSHHGKARYLADPPSTGESSLSDDDADDERPRIVAFAREKVPARSKSLRITKKDSGSSAHDRLKRSKEELEREERCRREEEERKRVEEAAQREVEIQQKARELAEQMERVREEARRIEEEGRRQKEEEEARQREEERQEREREEEQKRRREENEKKKREQEQRKKEEKEARQRRREEDRKKREEEDRKRIEEEEKAREEELRQQKEEEMRRKEEEITRKELEAKRKEEEARRKEEEWRRREREAREEARRKEEEAKKKEEEWRKREREAREEARRKEEELQRKEQEAREEARRKEEEWKRKEQEAKKKEQEARKKERELRKKEEEAKRKEQELKRKEEEARRKEEEARRREEELEIERRRVEEEREEAKRKEEEAQRREEELRKREEELQRRETEIATRRSQQQAEFRKREEEIRRRKGDAYDPETAWAPSSYGSASSFGGRSLKKEDDRLAEEARRREEEQTKKEEEARKEEEAKRAEEAKKEEEERLRREQEETDRIAAEELQEQLLVEAREEEERRFKEAQHRDAERRKMDEIWRQKQTEQAKRKQQEEYRRQEEQIRQQAEERKRQRSNTHEYANGSSSYHTTSSSPPSWTSSQANTWANSQSSFYSAPRTSTTSYSSSFEPKDDGLTDWQRRQEEMYQKQQEQFRKEQERMDAQRRARDAGRVPTKNEILAIYDNHERLWATMGSKSQLYWKDFPWPMFKTPASPEEITPHTVSAYMQSPHYPETAKVKTYKDRLRDHIRRWHPDRFETQTLPRVVDDQKETVREAAGSVVRALNDLNSRANNVNDMFT